MPELTIDAPLERVLRSLQAIGFQVVKRSRHVSPARAVPVDLLLTGDPVEWAPALVHDGKDSDAVRLNGVKNAVGKSPDRLGANLAHDSSARFREPE